MTMEYCYTNDSAHEMEVGQVFLEKQQHQLCVM